MSTEIKKILLVDDEIITLNVMSKALSIRGFECIKAQSATEALSFLNDFTPDLIISDYEMPDMNGFDFRKKIIESPSLKNIPFVFLTSHAGNNMKLKGLDLYAVDYITKDTPIEIIVSKLNNLFSTVKQEHEKSIQELKKAAIVLNLKSVPDVAPQLKNFEADFWYKTFQNYPGGDFIDFIKVDERYTFIILGDVMGKKWSAWFFSFSFLSYIRAAVRMCVYDNNLSTANILRRINSVIVHDPVLNDILSTLSMLLIDNEANSILYSGAGDLPIVHFKAADKSLHQIKSNGLLLGLFNEGEYNEDEIYLEKHDQLLIFSDGMIDFEDQEGKKSGHKDFIDFIAPLMGKKNTLQKIVEGVSSKNKKEQIDDCSIIIIEKT